MESAKIIAKLARMLRNVGLAEEIAQDAWVAALEQWGETGIPDNPGAWLMTTAKNRAIDQLRRRQLLERKSALMSHDPDLLGSQNMAGDSVSEAEDVSDDLLRLIFVACHPVLSMEGRVYLTLRMLGGLTPAEISRAFLTSESAIQQRIVRAKRTLGEARVPFEVPGAAEREQRLAAVLEVIYLIFNEGYAATAGEEWMRPALCEEALRLGRILAELAPTEPEVHGLVALMELQASRTPARVSASGEPILLLDQNRTLWDAFIPPDSRMRSRVRRHRRPTWRLFSAVRHRGMSRARPHGGGDRLATNRGSLRRPRRIAAVAHRDFEPSRRGIDGVWTRCRP
jgi:RNA polymerase sigma factor (sigma-70 family)